MDGSLRFRSIGQLLYTQNPFYLISCGLIIYGLHVATSGGDLQTQSALLALCLMGYTLLMSLTVVAVVRWAKVWQDARSILFVVMIGQLALSSSFDLLCLDSWSVSARLLLGGYLFALMSTEFVLRFCQLRFPFWYRLTYYSLMLVFFAFPVVSGYAVAENDLVFARWSAPFFSMLFAACLLLLVPAIRRGADYVRDNGTPWGWPLYPLSLFVVFVVVAGIRTHAIWMAFGSFSGAVVFEPFLLLPFALALLVLTVEYARKMGRTSLIQATFWLAPFLLLFARSRHGLTSLAIGPQLQAYCGSATTLAMLAILAFYLYLWVQRVRQSEHAVAMTLLTMSLFGEMPRMFTEMGIHAWAITSVAVAFYLFVCLRDRQSVARWLAVAVMISIGILQAGEVAQQERPAMILAAGFMLAVWMILGAVFKSSLAFFLRQIAAVSMLLVGVMMLVWYFAREPMWVFVPAIGVTATLALVYAHLVRRTWWIGIGGVHLVGFVVMLANSGGWQVASFQGAHWPLQSGLVCFAIGLVITSVKSGVHRRICRQRSNWERWASYTHGF